MYWSNLSKAVIGSCKLKLYRSHWGWGSSFSTCIFLLPIILIYFSITQFLKGQENAIKSSLEGSFILTHQIHVCHVLHMVSDDSWSRGIHLFISWPKQLEAKADINYMSVIGLVLCTMYCAGFWPVSYFLVQIGASVLIMCRLENTVCHFILSCPCACCPQVTFIMWFCQFATLSCVLPS